MLNPEAEEKANRLKKLFLFTLCPFFLWACASTGIYRFSLIPAGADRASFNFKGLTITYHYLDEDDRAQYLQVAGREAFSRNLEVLPLMTFVLEIKNKSGSEAIIDPAGTRLMTGFGPMLTPMNYAHLYVILPRGERDQTVSRELEGIVFDRPVTVPPGGSEEKMLFFKRPEKVASDVLIVLGGLYLGGAQVKSVLSFKAVPLDE